MIDGIRSFSYHITDKRKTTVSVSFFHFRKQREKETLNDKTGQVASTTRQDAVTAEYARPYLMDYRCGKPREKIA
jgi:hypothetical protein